MKIQWVKRPDFIGGMETIYRGQYFWRKWYAMEALYHLAPDSVGHWHDRGHLGNFFSCCHFCRLGLEDAVRRFRPTKQTRTQYTDWRKCEVGFCHRMTVLVDGRLYWAKHFPEKRKVAIYNSHLGRTPMGFLPETMVPPELRRAMREK